MSTNQDVVRRVFLEAINGNDPELFGSLLHPDFVDHNPLPGQPSGKAAGPYIVEHLVQVTGGSPDIVIHQIVGDGDLVAVRWTAGRGSLEALVFVRLERGTVIERWAAFNRNASHEQARSPS
jgi:predicted SnoaL-like aldol condensation-catalyzing enzyme